VINGRKGIGVELKASYYKQAILNLEAAHSEYDREQAPLFADAISGDSVDSVEQEKTRTLQRNTWKPKARA
jgi:hypothetical protein